MKYVISLAVALIFCGTAVLIFGDSELRAVGLAMVGGAIVGSGALAMMIEG